MENTFTLNLQEGRTAEESARRLIAELQNLLDQLNLRKIPIVVGPNENLPSGMVVGQPVIDWRSGIAPDLRVWNGKQLI